MRNKTILIVEDFDDSRAMMKMVLEMKGCLVVEAVNGREAVELAAYQCPDLILMDLRMPVMNGIEATRLILAQAETCHVPIVAISAHCEGDWKEEALDAGAVECVEKPVDFDALDRVLRRFLSVN